MASVNTYLNFKGQAEEAFNSYKSVFGGEFDGDGISRMKDMPPQEGMPELPDSEKDWIMPVSLPILGGHRLMGSDVPEAMGDLKVGNNVYISLQPDTRGETDKLFKALGEGGNVTMQLQDMFWGDYYGTLTDKFGVCWMFNYGKNV